MPVILIVDDNVELALNMAGYLTAKKHDVEVVHTGAEAYQQLGGRDFDLLILDWELPDTTGPEICKTYRSRGGMSGVLMLTGRKAPEDKVVGLEAGADDYLTKPFNIPEFNARVDALLRRASMSKQAPRQVFDESLVGQTFAGYKIESVLGTGGMGMVYKATHNTLKRTAAIKVLSGNYQGVGAKKRFEREAKAMSLLDHETLVKIFDYGIAEGTVPYIIMECVEGNPLSEVLQLCGPLPLKSGLQLFIEICQGLEHAHTQSIIHRDLKPSNIMILVGGEKAKVLDLGLAKFTDNTKVSTDHDLTLAGEVFGSPYYMSPEQGTNAPLDQRSDVYSLACVMYEAFSKERPFEGKSFVEITNAKLKTKAQSLCEKLKPQSFPQALDLAIRQALEASPDRRQSSMQEFREQLQTAIQANTVEQSKQPKILAYLKNLLGK